LIDLNALTKIAESTTYEVSGKKYFLNPQKKEG